MRYAVMKLGASVLRCVRDRLATLPLIALLLASGAPSGLAEQPAPPNEQVLRLVTANMPRSLDPINIDAQRIINNGFAEPLVHQSLDGARLIPALARSWALVEPTLWRIELQPHARFWSGAPVDAEAVRGALERHQRANPRARALLQGASFRAAGPTTLEIRTAAPDPAFLFKTVTIGIHNAAAAEAMGDPMRHPGQGTVAPAPGHGRLVRRRGSSVGGSQRGAGARRASGAAPAAPGAAGGVTSDAQRGRLRHQRRTPRGAATPAGTR